jgi:hypothetical protein
MVSGGFFDMLGIQPEAGRFFSDAERNDAQNAHAVGLAVALRDPVDTPDADYHPDGSQRRRAADCLR